MNRIAGLYESSEAVPWDEWSDVCRTTPTWFLDPAFLSAVERTLPAQARIFHAIVRAPDSKPAACASLCLYPVDLLSLASPAIRDRAAWLQRLLPGLTQLRVLMCGLPFSAGQSHLAFAPGADRPRALEQLDLLLRQLARREKAKLIVFKEFAEEERVDMDGLLERGYVRGDSPPMYELEKPFTSFGDYTAALKAHYRTNIKRAQRKFAAAGCRFVRLSNLADMRRVYTPEVHRLYEAVVMNSETRLEVLSHEFFLELAGQLPGQLALTVVYREDRLIGFTWELVDGAVYHFLFMGLDYRQNAETDLYFNLVYEALDHAFQSGARVVHVGQTADAFKSLLGCRGNRRYLYGRGVGPTFSWILRQASGLLFPPRPSLAPHDVFKAEASNAAAFKVEVAASGSKQPCTTEP
ncbi:MAG TPA: GNAT family N-acetyltransferase [Pirellulales bacterium]|jgi:predicted N-acyltransferase|nr:GNAT family N-acetyltransferase [Pirellulales bacterium]